MEFLVYYTGLAVITLITVMAISFATWCVAEFTIKQLKIVWWVTLYAFHRKKFRQWCKEHKNTLPEKHQQVVEFADGASD